MAKDQTYCRCGLLIGTHTPKDGRCSGVPESTTILDRPKCKCGHLVGTHTPEAGWCSGQTFSGLPCGCRKSKDEVLEAAFVLFVEILAGNPAAARSFALNLEIEGSVRGGRIKPWDVGVLLATAEGQEFWAAFIKKEGYRSDPKARKVLRLLVTFPTLRQAVDVGALEIPVMGTACRPFGEGWSPWELERFAFSEDESPAARHAARFILGVWSRTRLRACGPFLLHEAVAAWDDDHKAPFMKWVRDPWWA